jgi:hypothetical protein
MNKMNEIKIPSEKVARYFNKVKDLYFEHRPTTEQAGWYNFLSTIEDATDEIWHEATKAIIEDNEIILIDYLDIKYLLQSIITAFLVQQTSLHTKKEIYINYNNSTQRNGNNRHLKLTFDNDIPDIKSLDAKELADPFVEIIKQAITKIQDINRNNIVKFSLTCEVQISHTLSPQQIDSIYEVDDRLKIFFKKYKNKYFLCFNGIYIGSYAFTTPRISSDLTRIFALLEFEGILTEKYENIRLLIPPKKVSFNLLYNDQSGYEPKVLPDQWNKYSKKFYITPHHLSTIDNYFNIFSNYYKNNILRFVLNLLNTEQHRFSSYEFLKYWQALEIMLGNPEFEIYKNLSYAYKVVTGGENPNDLKKYWELRNKIVHEGLLEVDHSTLWKFQHLVKHVFDRLHAGEGRIENYIKISRKTKDKK